MNHIRVFALLNQTLGGSGAKKIRDRVNAAFVLRHLRDVDGRLDTQHGNARLFVILQKVAVVTGDLNRQPIRIQRLRLEHAFHDRLRVTQHGVRE